MRILTILVIMAFLFAVAQSIPPDKRVSTHFKYSVVVFDHEANRVICEGLIAAEQFKEWFDCRGFHCFKPWGATVDKLSS